MARASTTKLPCLVCRAAPHRRQKRDVPGFRNQCYRCIECGSDYEDRPEADVKAEVKAALRHHPRVAVVFERNASNEGKRGKIESSHPDLYGYLTNGRAFFVEVKAHSGLSNRKVRERKERQEKRLEHARRNGCIAFVAWSALDVVRELKT